MGLFRTPDRRYRADPTVLSYSTSAAHQPGSTTMTAADQLEPLSSLPTSFATSVEALVVNPDAPPPGAQASGSGSGSAAASRSVPPGAAPPAIHHPSAATTTTTTTSPASGLSRSDRVRTGRGSTGGPSPSSSRPSSTNVSPSRAKRQSNANSSSRQTLGVPGSSPLPQHPFQGVNGRAYSDSALPNGAAAAAAARAGRPLSNGTTANPGKTMLKTRPNSFLSFLGGGGGASRSSVLSATAGVNKKPAKSSKSASSSVSATGGKVQTAQAVALGSAPSRKGPSRVVALVGNVRSGIGRMIIEELVRNRTIVVALTDAQDGQFGKDLEALALSPSLFHAFPIPALFGPAFVVAAPSAASGQSAAAGGGPNSYFSSPGGSTPNLSVGSTSSDPSVNQFGIPTPPNLGSTSSFTSSAATGKKNGRFSKPSPSKLDPSSAGTASGTGGKLSAGAKAFNERHACLIELANIFKSYRVDTVLAIFEPRDRHTVSKASTVPRATAAAEPSPSSPATPAPQPLPPLGPAEERARIDEMERVCLQAAIECGAGRFATCAFTPSLFRTPLSQPRPAPPDHVRRAPLSATVFRWGVLMNELAAGVPPNEVGDTALGKWLNPPPKRSGRLVVDFGKSTAFIPQFQGKGKGTEGVSLTLAEDVARFVSLACKMKAEWEWNTGTMVGERIRGGWEEIIDMLDTICRYNFKREYVSAPPPDPSPNSSSDFLGGGGLIPGAPNGFLPRPGADSDDSDASDSPEALTIPATGNKRERSPADIDDVLRGLLAAEQLDASSVRLGEFLRVWFSPRHRLSAGLSPPVHGPRAVRPMSSQEALNAGRPGGPRPSPGGPPPNDGAHWPPGAGQQQQRGPPPARSSGANMPRPRPPSGGPYPPSGPGNGAGALAMSSGPGPRSHPHPTSVAPAIPSPLAQSA